MLFGSSVKIASDEEFLKNGKSPVLTVMSAGHAMQVFINGQLSGKATYTFCFIKLVPSFILSLFI